MGFTSCSEDGNVFFYDLAQLKETQSRAMEKGFTRQNIQFQSVTNIPGQLYNAIAVSNNRTVYRIDNIESKHTQASSDYNLT